MKSKPVHEVRIGAIKAAVWKNETAKGMRHQATFSRLYHDGDQWHSTDSFGRDDLLVLAKVADQTHSWICAQCQDTESAAKTTAPQNPNAKILPQGQRRMELTTANSVDA
jgi:hypothetical protein